MSTGGASGAVAALGPCKVLVADALAPSGLEVLRAAPGLEVEVATGLAPDALRARIGAYQALVVRSATQVTAEVLAAADNLRLIGRAGIGVDNVDVEAATARGVIVMNTPTANATTTAEHALALIFALARRVPQATASMKAGKWEKKKFEGREITGRTLGVVGMGNIGRIVAQRAQALQMKVVAFDPFLSDEAAAKQGVERVALDDLLARADFVTVHTPFNDQTRGLLGAAAFDKMKRGAYVVCAARGGIVDEAALAEALRSGKLAGAALDVFAEEPPPKDHPLFALDGFICTPHLGASTEEAQDKVSREIAQQVVDFLRDGTVRNAVNAPVPSPEERKSLAPYLTLARKLGALASQLWPEGSREITVEFVGGVTERATRPITAELLVGLLSGQLDLKVNVVNAAHVARERGLRVTEVHRAEPGDYANEVNLRITGAGALHVLGGAVLVEGGPRLVRIDGVRVELVPAGYVLFVRNEDRPGVIGRIGTLLGERQVNISHLQVGVDQPTGQAIALWSTDSAVTSQDIAEVRRLPHVVSAMQVKL
ncbi:MAG TPA: phosphoglycerate dehydrogenase [Myxococcota bacterium]|nr:phosphoglycerate dehydrogenase [Myxococcota bacterium]